jgi:hypothetical protein
VDTKYIKYSRLQAARELASAEYTKIPKKGEKTYEEKAYD